MIDKDTIQRFLFEQAEVRGGLVHLNESYQKVIEQHDYPAAIRELLAQTLLMVTIFQSILKEETNLSIQVRGNGILRILNVQCRGKYQLRAIAHWEGDCEQKDFKELIGDGVIAVIIENQNTRESYQGVVELKGNNLAQCFEHYFQQSEQLATRLWLVHDEQSAAGLFIQALPSHNKSQQQHWQHLEILTNTVTPQELLTLDNIDLLTRLYHQETVMVFENESVVFRCDCNKHKMEAALKLFSHAELKQLFEERDMLSVTCEYCNNNYDFDEIDIAAIFADGMSSDDDNKTTH